jgi:SRSO17 transposase
MQARRRNIQSIGDAVPQSDEQALHHFISNSSWDERAVLDKIARDANALLGGTPDSFLLIDESGFPKKGRESVGVARSGAADSVRSITARRPYSRRSAKTQWPP